MRKDHKEPNTRKSSPRGLKIAHNSVVQKRGLVRGREKLMEIGLRYENKIVLTTKKGYRQVLKQLQKSGY